MGKRARSVSGSSYPGSNGDGSSSSSSSSASISSSDQAQEAAAGPAALPVPSEAVASGHVEEETAEIDLDAGEGGMAQANRAAKQSAMSSWPLGPEKYADLFAWPDYNAEVLFERSESRDQFLRNFQALLQKNICHFDAYSGLGTASIACKMQLKAFLAKFNENLDRLPQAEKQSRLTCIAIVIWIHCKILLSSSL